MQNTGQKFACLECFSSPTGLRPCCTSFCINQNPPNTGNIIRLCANTGARLHLIRPLGFELDDRQLRRAGLDYHEWVDVRIHEDLDAFQHAVAPARMLAFTTRGRRRYTEIDYLAGDALLFGPETRGLPDPILHSVPEQQCLILPMRPDNRSLNLSNSVAIAVYEAWRQLGFDGAAAPRSEAPVFKSATPEDGGG